jgi:hypothetical protein
MPRIAPFAVALLAACSSAQSSPPAAPQNPAPLAASAAGQVAEPGKPAPDFTLADVDGKPVTLSALKGKTVVLEWFNPDCPFVEYAYDRAGLSDVSRAWVGKGVEWLIINSNKPGSSGSGLDTNREAREDWKLAPRVFLDETGAVGRAYGAKTTPQMVVVAPDGTVAYVGAYDNAPLGNAEGGTKRPYTEDVLAAVTAGQPAPFARQKPYGCSVKY